MNISNESIEEFKRIYRKEFGKDLNDAEAREMAEELLQFYRLILPKQQ